MGPGHKASDGIPQYRTHAWCALRSNLIKMINQVKPWTIKITVLTGMAWIWRYLLETYSDNCAYWNGMDLTPSSINTVCRFTIGEPGLVPRGDPVAVPMGELLEDPNRSGILPQGDRWRCKAMSSTKLFVVSWLRRSVEKNKVHSVLQIMVGQFSRRTIIKQKQRRTVKLSVA